MVKRDRSPEGKVMTIPEVPVEDGGVTSLPELVQLPEENGPLYITSTLGLSQLGVSTKSCT